jgi:hypothetical protein
VPSRVFWTNHETFQERGLRHIPSSNWQRTQETLSRLPKPTKQRKGYAKSSTHDVGKTVRKGGDEKKGTKKRKGLSVGGNKKAKGGPPKTKKQAHSTGKCKASPP